MIKAVLLDLDGTILDSKHIHKEAFDKALLDFGYPTIDNEDHKLNFDGRPTSIKIGILIERGIVKSQDKQAIILAKNQYTKEALKSIQPDLSKIELCSKLKQMGYKLACVSNAIRESIENILSSMDIISYFDLIISNADVKNNKPAPDCYLLAIEKLGLFGTQCLAVEDSPVGIESVAGSGCILWAIKDPSLLTYKRIMQEIKYVDGLLGVAE